MDNECYICYDKADIPHQLPCNHVFCFICILKHLRNSMVCPVCWSGFFSVVDLKTECKKNSSVKFPMLILKKNKANYLKMLKKYKLITEGDSVYVFRRRYRELMEQLMVNQFRTNPIDDKIIVKAINCKEIESQCKKKRNMKNIYQNLLELKKKCFKSMNK